MEKELPEIVKEEEPQVLEIEVYECPVCGFEIGAEDVKCPRCEVDFEEMEEQTSPSPEKTDTNGLEKTVNKENGFDG